MHQVVFWAVAQLNRLITPVRFLNLIKKGLRLATLLLLSLTFLSWSSPAQAAERTNSRLEEQVLQILRNHPEVIVESVQKYQQAQQQQILQTQQTFVEDLKTDPKRVIGNSPTTGSAELKIVLVEFSDFQCPYCAQAHQTVKEFMTKHQDAVTLVYKHFPLVPIHPEALPAAKAAWAAGQQGKFWEYHDALFEQQNQLGEEFYLATAQKLNLDLEQFNQDRNSDTANTAIGQDFQLADALGLSGTPFFVMNGETLSGAIQLSDMENALSRIMAASM